MAENKINEFENMDAKIQAIKPPLSETAKDRFSVKGKGVDLIIRPKDKVNRNVWLFGSDILDYMNENKPVDIDVSRKDSTKKAIVRFRAYYGELEENDFFGKLEKNLTTPNYLNQFDKEVCIAAAALLYEQGELMTLAQIHYTMGYTTAPSEKQLKKIKESLEKMRTLKIMIDNTEEHNAYDNMILFKYNGVVLPWESVEKYVNGQLTDAVIHLFREPPLMTFARIREQITTTSRIILASPVNKTPRNIILQDYLIDRISSIQREANKKTRKNKKASNRILYETVFEHLKVADGKAKGRVKEKIEYLLKHFKKEGMIKNYKIEEDGVSIIL